MQSYIWNDLDADRQRALLKRPALANDADFAARVAAIIERVRREGDAAIRELTAAHDRVRLESLEVTAAEMDEAEAALGEPQRAAIRAAAANIEKFHRAQLPAQLVVDTAVGVRCERVSRPIDAVGLYVPAGTPSISAVEGRGALPAGT